MIIFTCFLKILLKTSHNYGMIDKESKNIKKMR